MGCQRTDLVDEPGSIMCLIHPGAASGICKKRRIQQDQVKQPSRPAERCRHMEKIFKFCKSYAQNFTPEAGSILMKGATGLGKTHLSLAIANEVIRRGYGVIYVSAPALFAKLEKEHFSRSADSDTMDTLLGCDLLIIDDLGTEFKSQFATAQAYQLFNARVLQSKPVIVSTNLTMAELEREYSNRFVSRVNGAAQKLDFVGDDLRIKRF